MKTEVLVAFIAAAAACLAALIAGGASLLTLLSSKEQKVSEFRLDALRADIAEFVSRAHQISSYYPMHPVSSSAEAWSVTREDYIGLNRASTRIKLRLNPKEKESNKVLELMKRMEGLFADLTKPGTLTQVNAVVAELELCGPPLLQKEWKRVKRGEPIYIVGNVGALLFFLGAGYLAVHLFLQMIMQASAIP